MKDKNRSRAAEGQLRGNFLTMRTVWDWFAALGAGIGVAVAVGAPAAFAAGEERVLSLYNIHTKETLNVIYKRDGEYDAEAMKKIDHIMRDWRRDQPTKMDPGLIDLIWELHTELGSEEPVHVISGYRSKRTNERLRRRGGGQARNSRHILGKAADIHFPDVNVKDLRNSALVRERGGVGYYPRSGLPFVHVDTDRVRHWPRLPRQELALLFRDGKTQHRPRDGKAISKRDVRLAMARYKRLGRPLPVLPGQRKKRAAPQRMLASLTPSFGLGASKSRKDTPKTGRMTLAAADPRRTGPVVVPARVEPGPDFDPEHPEELSYQPVPVLPLMGERSLSYDVRVTALAHPLVEKTDYLMRVPGRGLPTTFKSGNAFAELRDADRFKGAAIMDVLAEAPAVPEPNRRPARRVRTAGL